MNKFAERLQELRVEKNLSQRELSRLTNLSQASIARWEANKQSPTADTIIIFALFFKVSADYLLGLEN